MRLSIALILIAAITSPAFGQRRIFQGRLMGRLRPRRQVQQPQPQYQQPYQQPQQQYYTAPAVQPPRTTCGPGGCVVDSSVFSPAGAIYSLHSAPRAPGPANDPPPVPKVDLPEVPAADLGKTAGCGAECRCAEEQAVAAPQQPATRQVSLIQSIAQQKANIQASRDRMFHPGGSMGGGRFEGVGFSSSSNNVPTCTPRGRGYVLAGDAIAQSRTGRWYRCRIWR